MGRLRLRHTLFGGRGDDEREGNQGNDLLYGGQGRDDLEGDGGNDRLFGNEGNDEIDGDDGADILHGNQGNDTLDGGRGNDILAGGIGADRFEFDLGDGRDRIVDFQNGLDRIELDDVDRGQVQRAINGAVQQGGDTILTVNASTVIVLEDFNRANLDLNDFTF